MTKRFACLLTGACLLSGLATRLPAAGFAIHEQSGRAMGTAGAYAGAEGAASLFYNPAGIARLEGTQLEMGINIIMPATDFTGPTDHPTYGTVAMDKQTFPPVDLYLTGRLTEQARWGVGVFTYMGLGTRWPEDWAGRTVTEEINLQTFTINPSVAFTLGENTSLGLGLDLMWGKALLSKDSYTGYPFNGYVDVELDGTGLGYGFNVGLQHRVNEELNLGLSYRSGLTLSAEGETTFGIQDVENPSHVAYLQSLFPTTDANLDLDIPDLAIAGAQWTPAGLLDGKLTWRGDLVFTRWNKYASLDIDFETNTAGLADSHSPKLYENTWAFRTGVEYALNEDWDLCGGWYYEQNAVVDNMVEPSLPDAERNGLSLGASWQATESLGIDAYFIQILLQDRVSSFAELPGGYESGIPIFGLSVRKEF
ncbi:MAG: outer membrane protein transport protein [Candidatus Delongbacteria bacterium]